MLTTSAVCFRIRKLSRVLEAESRIFLLLIVIFALSSCTENKLLKHEVTDRIDGELLSADEFVGSGFIGTHDDYLLFQSFDPDSLAIAYRQEGDMLNEGRHFVLKGRGPKEFDQPVYRMASMDSVYILNEEGLGNIESITLGTISIANDRFDFQTVSRRDLSWLNPFYFGGDFIVLDDGRILVTGDRFETRNLLSIIDIEQKSVTPLGYWMKDSYDGPDLPKQSVYLSNSKIYKNGNRILFACGEGRYLELLTLEGDKIVEKRSIYDIYPEYESHSDKMNYRIYRTNYRGMKVSATDNYIYVRLVLLRSPDENYKGYPWYYSDEVEVYDWNGNFIRNYQTDKPFYAMTVTSDDKCLYTLTKDLRTDEILVYRYNLL